MYKIVIIFLFTVVSGFAYGSTIQLAPTDDAFIVDDLNDPVVSETLRRTNAGNLDFLRVWYAWNVTTDENQFLSLAYLKFDLSDLTRDEIASAKLAMYAESVLLSEESRVVSIYVGNESSWDESTVTFGNAPQFSETPAGTKSLINKPGWYEWEITNAVKEKAGNPITLVVIFETIEDKSEDLAVFTSKEGNVTSNTPVLIIQQPEPTPLFDVNAGFLASIFAIAAAAGLGIMFGFFLARRKK